MFLSSLHFLSLFLSSLHFLSLCSQTSDLNIHVQHRIYSRPVSVCTTYCHFAAVSSHLYFRCTHFEPLCYQTARWQPSLFTQFSSRVVPSYNRGRRLTNPLLQVGLKSPYLVHCVGVSNNNNLCTAVINIKCTADNLIRSTQCQAVSVISCSPYQQSDTHVDIWHCLHLSTANRNCAFKMALRDCRLLPRCKLDIRSSEMLCYVMQKERRNWCCVSVRNVSVPAKCRGRTDGPTAVSGMLNTHGPCNCSFRLHDVHN